MSGDQSGFFDNLPGGHLQRGAAHGDTARTERTGSIGHIVGIALDDSNVADRHTELRVEDLRHAGGVSMAVAVRSKTGVDGSVRFERDAGRLEKAGARAQHSGESR